MKRPQALGFITLGLLLGLEPFVARVEASPYVTHQTDGASREIDPIRLPSCSSLPVPQFSTGSRQESSLSINFEPGIRDAIAATLPPSLPGNSGPLPISRSPEGEAGSIPAPTPTPRNRTVPEPASIVLVVTGLIGLAARRRLLRNRPLA